MANEFESVKIKKPIVDKVRKNKEKTGVPVGTFFEQAAIAKLEAINVLDHFAKTGNLIINKKTKPKTKPSTHQPIKH